MTLPCFLHPFLPSPSNLNTDVTDSRKFSVAPPAPKFNALCCAPVAPPLGLDVQLRSWAARVHHRSPFPGAWSVPGTEPVLTVH